LLTAPRVGGIQIAANHQAYCRASSAASREVFTCGVETIVFFEVPEKCQGRIFQDLIDIINQYIAELEFGSPEEEIARICRAIRHDRELRRSSRASHSFEQRIIIDIRQKA
jgi:hypothetical protein